MGGASVEPTGIGIVGLGTISAQYLATLDQLPSLRLVAVADLDASRAAQVAAERDGVVALSVADLVAHPGVQIVVNLTVPAAHAEIALAAIAAGKHVYGEKPLAATVADAERMLRAAERGGVRLGGAPDTVLGTGIQTARAALDAGLIGRPVSATAVFASGGHESWHPHPDFYYLPGGGPLYDMGPYYLTSLITLFGPVASVQGAASRSRSEREIASGPRAGERVPVSVDTHVTGILTHASGALSTITMSFDAPATTAPRLEVHGETGSLEVPDPNHFEGAVTLRRGGDDPGRVLPIEAGYRPAGRGVGLADFASAIASGGPARADGALAFHVLDVMESLLTAAASGGRVDIASSVERPAPVPLGPAP